MTKFVPLRDWCAKTGKLLKELERDGLLVVTENGSPTAVVLKVDPDNFDRELQSIARVRFARTIDSMRTSAKAAGTEKLTMKQIDAEIAAARRERRRRASA